MVITLYKTDISDSGWFYILQSLNLIDKDVKYDDVFDEYGEIKEGFQNRFSDDMELELGVNSVALT